LVQRATRQVLKRKDPYPSTRRGGRWL